MTLTERIGHAVNTTAPNTRTTAGILFQRFNMTTTNYDFPQVGCYIDQSAGDANRLNRRTISFAEAYGFKADFDLKEDDEDYSQILSELADDAVSFLNDLETRSFMCWQFEDNSLFLMADVDSALEDVGFVSTRSPEVTK